MPEPAEGAAVWQWLRTTVQAFAPRDLLGDGTPKFLFAVAADGGVSWMVHYGFISIEITGSAIDSTSPRFASTNSMS